MNVLDLFSGIGGFSLGLERTGGFKTVAFCEIEPFAQQVLSKHWPEVSLFPDVTELSSNHIGESVDVICGGFPCQDISVAGKKKGLIDEHGNTTRSGLWFEFKRLIQEIGPKYVIIENVANLRSSGLATVIKDLWEIGYVGEWHIISARSVGACHLRERVWIIAYPDSSRVRIESRGSSWQSGSAERVSLGHGTEQSLDSTHSNSKRGGIRGTSRIPQELSSIRSNSAVSANPDHLRLWSPFATEEEKSQWWAEATASLSPVYREVYETQPTVCGGNDGVSKGLDKTRAKRIKALGNAIIPQIAELIGRSIIKYEEQQ